MSPSEKVRALLDERGIEHDDNDANTEVTGVRITRWKNGGKRDVRYEEWRNGTTRLDAGNVSPEQAIAATVGNGTDLSKRLREVHGLHSFAELFGFSWEDESDWDWHDVACAMADTIDATAGVGTCRLVDNDSGPDMHCTACGGEVDDEYWYFMDSWGYSRCPHCGARIIEEETE